ncbi:MAG: thioredoxin domain-containing protein, partial [Deltaproteobacteria bacterium]|nr:thioredoxin domain-containing protein [Deltaproteobacteria bacterium]
GEVRVVYRNNPLSFHPGARPAAEAALAAHAQGRFWEMHDALYNHQDQLDASQIEGYAAALELDLDRFRGDVAARRFAAAVDADLVAAATLGVQGTPNIFVNGRLLRGARDLEEVEEVLAEELSRGQALRKQGIEDVHQHLTRDGRVFTPLDEEVFAFDTASSPARGAGPGAAVEIVLFSDFQCPYCARINSALEEVVRRDPGRVRLVFKQFPLAFHEHARAAAAASLAAHEQGRFWEMHDLLFGDAQHLDRESLEARAARLGLDLDAFRAALDGDRYRERLEADMDEGRRAGVRGTPTFFINGRRYDAPGRAADDIRKVIDTLTGDR